MKIAATLAIAYTAGMMSSVAAAAESSAETAEPAGQNGARVGFVEATGGYGLQFGQTAYVPDGPPGQYQHPLTNGFNVGATAGVYFKDDLAALATYEHARARSRSGEITGVVDDIDASISYHSLLVGVRLQRAFGPGALVGELGAGVVFPFETELEYEYGEALAPAEITGDGRQVSEYGFGYGGRARFGYRISLGAGVYASSAVALETFQSSNNGRETELDNFVEDFDEEPPEATDAVIEHDDDGGAQPNTYPVSSARVQLSVGAEF